MFGEGLMSAMRSSFTQRTDSRIRQSCFAADGSAILMCIPARITAITWIIFTVRWLRQRIMFMFLNCIRFRRQLLCCFLQKTIPPFPQNMKTVRNCLRFSPRATAGDGLCMLQMRLTLTGVLKTEPFAS